MEILNNDLMKKIEKEKDRVVSARIEKNKYLGIYKERVIVALTKEEVEEKLIYSEVIKALKKEIAINMILSRAVELKYLKKYMDLANKYKVNCKLVDGLSYVGDIALVVSASDAIENQKEPLVVSKLERIIAAGLPKAYYDALGKKVSAKYLEVIKEKIPDLLDEYEELKFFDRICGEKCALEEKLGGKLYG